MFVLSGAREMLTDNEQQKFLEEELPAFAEKAQRLGIDLDTVTERLRAAGGDS